MGTGHAYINVKHINRLFANNLSTSGIINSDRPFQETSRKTKTKKLKCHVGDEHGPKKSFTTRISKGCCE